MEQGRCLGWKGEGLDVQEEVMKNSRKGGKVGVVNGRSIKVPRYAAFSVKFQDPKTAFKIPRSWGKSQKWQHWPWSRTTPPAESEQSAAGFVSNHSCSPPCLNGNIYVIGQAQFSCRHCVQRKLCYKKLFLRWLHCMFILRSYSQKGESYQKHFFLQLASCSGHGTLRRMAMSITGLSTT